MVEIREEVDAGATTGEGAASSSSSTTSSTGGQANGQAAGNRMSLLEFFKSNQSEALCFALRLATLYFSLGYILPLGSPASQYNCYSKAFVAAAATNAFRLHQRMSGSTFRVMSADFWKSLILEDSAHYLFYSLLFMLSAPVTMALLPIFLYALLHTTSFALKAATSLGYANNPTVQKISTLKTQHTGNLLSCIACAEVAIMPVCIGLIFSGKASILFPFVYYRFLTLRYVSRRNPYTRETFSQLKISLYQMASSGSCPAFVSNLIYKVVGFIERLAPAMA